MLLQNQTLRAQYPYRRMGASTIATEAGSLRSQLGIRGSSQLTRFVSGWEKKQSIPQGYGVGTSLFAPLKGGGMGISAASDGLAGAGTTTGSLAMGRAISVTLAGAGDITPPSLTLLVQLACTLIGEGLVGNAAMVGSVSMASTLAGQGDLNGALGMLASCVAALGGAGTVSSSTSMYGIAHMSANIYVNQSTATVQQLVAGVWDALAVDFNNAGTMGQKLNAAGTAGDPWTANLSGYAGAQAGAQVMTKGRYLALK